MVSTNYSKFIVAYTYEQVAVCKDAPCGNINGVIAGDFSYDGKLSLLAIQTDQTAVYNIYIFNQVPSADAYPSFASTESSFPTTSYPFVADFFGNHTTTLMLYNDDQRQVVNTNSKTTTPFASLVSTAEGCLDPAPYQNAPFLSPHFNSVVDVNADCRADLIITSLSPDGRHQLEYWYTVPLTDGFTARYCLKNVDTLTDLTLHSLNFADVNFDGLIDMVTILADVQQSQYIAVNYNNYDQPIENPNLCQSNTNVAKQVSVYPYESLRIANSTYTVVTSMQAHLIYNQAATSTSALFAPYVRFGDFLSSGYPGALITVGQTEPQTVYLANVGVSIQGLEVRNPRALELQLQPDIKGFNQIIELTSIVGSFIDFGENG